MFVVTDCTCQHKRVGSNPDATLKGDAEDVSENEETTEETKVPLSDDNPNRYRDEVKESKQFRKSKSVSSADRGPEPTIHLPKSETVTTDLDADFCFLQAVIPYMQERWQSTERRFKEAITCFVE